jgi:hypothetical protein
VESEATQTVGPRGSLPAIPQTQSTDHQSTHFSLANLKTVKLAWLRHGNGAIGKKAIRFSGTLRDATGLKLKRGSHGKGKFGERNLRPNHRHRRRPLENGIENGKMSFETQREKGNAGVDPGRRRLLGWQGWV